MHPRWNGNVKNGFDIALIRLPRPIEYMVFPDLYPGNDVFEHNSTTLTLGWSLYDHPIQGGIQMLKPGNLRMGHRFAVLKHRDCPGKVKQHLKQHMICIFSRDQNMCKGEYNSKVD